jgi:hypothetical protein
MYALFTEVNADESHIEAARDFLPKVAVPMARGAGAKAGYWLARRKAAASTSLSSTPKTKRVPWQPGSRWASRRCLTRRPA